MERWLQSTWPPERPWAGSLYVDLIVWEEEEFWWRVGRVVLLWLQIAVTGTGSRHRLIATI